MQRVMAMPMHEFEVRSLVVLAVFILVVPLHEILSREKVVSAFRTPSGLSIVDPENWTTA
jgi:hypothetical protein